MPARRSTSVTLARRCDLTDNAKLQASLRDIEGSRIHVSGIAGGNGRCWPSGSPALTDPLESQSTGAKYIL